MALTVWTILTIILIVVVFILAFKIIKKVIAALFVASLILSLIAALLGFFVYLDAKDIKENFLTEDKLLLLRDATEYPAGVIIKPIKGEESPYSPLSTEELDAFKEKELSEIIGENYKIFIVEMETLENNLPDTLDFTIELKKEEIITLLRSDDPIDVLAEIMVKEQGDLSSRAKEAFKRSLEQKDSNIKNQIFMLTLPYIFPEGMPQLFLSLKKEELKVYPETIIFKIIKSFPDTIINKMTERLN